MNEMFLYFLAGSSTCIGMASLNDSAGDVAPI